MHRRSIAVIIAVIVLTAAAVIAPSCAKRDVSVEETPIRVLDEKVGRGQEVKDGDLVTISYIIKLEDGRVVLTDDSYGFEVGRNAVIGGVDETVRGMRIGGRRVVACPPQKHWGRAGYGNGTIPPNQTLTMDITLKSIR